MSFEKARDYLKSRGYEDRIKVFEESTATVAAAAAALGCKEDEIAKSLALIAGDEVILILAKGTARLDNAKYKAEFHTKAKMIGYDEVGNLVGHAAGGVCPFGVNDGVKVYLDVSLKDFDVVYPACGSSESTVRLTLGELEELSGYIKWVDVCK